MSYAVKTFCDVPERARALGLNLPEGLSLLPRNFEDATGVTDLIHESSAPTVRSLFRQAGLQETKLEKEGQRIPTIQENEFALLLPTLFISGLIISGRPDLIAIALNVVSNYATDFFKGITGKRKVKFNIVVQRKSDSASKKIEFEGDPEALKDLSDIVRNIWRDDETS